MGTSRQCQRHISLNQKQHYGTIALCYGYGDAGYFDGGSSSASR